MSIAVMALQRLAGGLARWLLVPTLCAALAGCRTTALIDSSAATALRVPERAGELVVKTAEGHGVHIGKGSRLSFLLHDGSWTEPVEGRDLCVSEEVVGRCQTTDEPAVMLRWADVAGVEVDNFDGLKTFGAVVLVTALVAVVVVVVVLAVNGGGGGGGHLGGGGGGGHLGGGGGGHLGGGGGGHGIPGGVHASGGWGHARMGSPARAGRPRENMLGDAWETDDDDRKHARGVALPPEEMSPAAPVLPLFKRTLGRHG
jgi:hypothetical protein